MFDSGVPVQTSDPQVSDVVKNAEDIINRSFIFLSLTLTTSHLTPGITRRPEPLAEHDNSRVVGRVHAVVRHRRRLIGATLCHPPRLRRRNHGRLPQARRPFAARGHGPFRPHDGLRC